MEISNTHTDTLEKRALAVVPTVGPDGDPRNNPVWSDGDQACSGAAIRGMVAEIAEDRDLTFSSSTALNHLGFNRNPRYQQRGQRVVTVVRTVHTTVMGRIFVGKKTFQERMEQDND